MPIGGLENSAQRAMKVGAAIADASQRTGVAFDYLMAQAQVESSFNPQAQASTSSAAGLFQFTRQTWLATLARHGDEHGFGWAANAISRDGKGHFTVLDPALRQQIMDLRFDVDASSLMAASLSSDNAELLRAKLGIEPEPVDLYLAHFLGGSGAAKFLAHWQSEPVADAAALFPKAATANRAIFFDRGGAPRSLNEVRSRFEARMSKAGQDIGPRFTPDPMAPVPTLAPTLMADLGNSASEFLSARNIEPMPGRLSMAFAERAYRQLASLSYPVRGA
jgi:Transglycosylase SLT domain